MPDPLLNPTLELPGVLKTRLRPWTFADAPALVRHANDERVARHMRDTFPYPYSASDAEFFLCLVADSARDLFLAIEVDGEPVGSVGVHFKTDVRRQSAEIGYWLAPTHWGKGLATAVVRSTSAYVLANFEVCRLYAVVFANNPASARVLEKAGYEFEGRLRRNVIKNDEVLDSLLFAQVV
ncbi:GNAT family N-acetyltransferase [Hymenobacter sp. ISL-91]|uniref:GNAT family N-acetyltransferase n=1 Tax=Hymenobacter sp. ISL-91 TaxID=2819151 RepID=UPI001BED01BC|nr:GNAT family protein [Hymenobacter sp. ISL-91]MBT2556502.1 GNAT family N-acetyltransferase [Hymenobacter sp. ISL-91]